MWQFPWKYKESFTISLGLFLIGTILEFALPCKIPALLFPINLIFGINILALFVLLHIYLGKSKIIQWLTSIPASISSITLFVILSLLMGFIPQSENANQSLHNLGFEHIQTTWQYLFAELYFLFTLGLITAKRSIPFRIKNIDFMINHLGLLLIIMGMTLGAGDKTKVGVQLHENKVEWRGYNQNGQITELPIAMKLTKFSIEDYNPSMVLVNNKTAEAIDEKKHNQQFLIEKDASITMGEWTIKIISFLPDATISNNTFINFKSTGSVPAAFVEAKNVKGDTIKGWLSCGNYLSPMISIRLDSFVSLAMTKPHPKKYSSKLTIYTQDNKTIDTTIYVNQAFSVNGWKIYQTGFDEKMGKWSTSSIVQVVRDPWLPVVYTGIFMLIFGAIRLLFRKQKSEDII